MQILSTFKNKIYVFGTGSTADLQKKLLFYGHNNA